MNLGWVNTGERIACGAAVLLFAFTFLDWYGVDQGASNLLGYLVLFEDGGNAWGSLGVLPILLTALSAAVVALVLLRVGALDPASRGSMGEVLCVFGGLAMLLVAAHIVFPPDIADADGNPALELTLEPGIYLSLFAAIGVSLGGWLSRGVRSEADART